MTTKPNSFLAFLSTLMIFAGLGAAMLGYGFYLYSAPGPLTEKKLVLIERGMGGSAIAQKLEDENVISNALLFKIAARVKGESLKAGEYEFPRTVPMAVALSMMQKGKVFDRVVTIREGLTSYQVVQLLNAVEELEGEITDIPAEGTLLPETYHYMRGDKRGDILTKMKNDMVVQVYNFCGGLDLYPSDVLQRFDEPCGTLPSPLETIGDVLTLASIVEKETGVPEERRRVAGVFINRLNKGMALQTDPTVIYAITKGKMKDDGRGPLGRRLLKKDLEIDDPYNTYKYPGLPPGPIANPGRASIEAVLNPEEHDYIYFVADGTGGHVFSKTLAEHNANVAKWRKIRREQN